MFIRSLLCLAFLFSLISFTQAENSWITKKEDKKKIEKKPKAFSAEWIKKKIKKNKKEYKKEEKKITKEVKSWITKKSNETYIENIDQLPDEAIYFTASNQDKSILVYGYVLPDTASKLIDYKYYETSKGLAFFNDGKTVCKVGSSILDISDGEVTARVSGKCSNGIKFTGRSTQNENIGDGLAKTKDGENRFVFDFNSEKIAISKIYERNLSYTDNPEVGLARNDFEDLKITGKYYALLIGNSNYAQWISLTSPINDITEIEQILETKYNFEKIITVKDGDRDRIFNAFDELSEITTDNDYVLIYYSGHGDEKGSKSYWIPVDAKKKYSSKWINISDIENYLSEIPARHLAVMVDSCYFAGFKGSNVINEQAKSKHYNKLLKKRARVVLASGQNEPVSDTGKGDHSIFGITFIQALKNNENAISLQEIGNNIGYAHANMSQMPIYMRANHWGHGGGDLVFVVKK